MAIVLVACSANTENETQDVSESDFSDTEGNNFIDSNENGDEINDTDSDGCRFEDDVYSAIINYYNPETGFSNSYTLDVEVEDCQVVQIYFTNGGYLDEDHISPAELDENGYATVYGENGKTYDVQIDY